MPKNKRARMLILMAADIAAIQLCSFLALLIRFDLNIAKIPAEYSANVLSYGLIHTALTIAFFFLAHLYSTMWSVAGIREVIRIVIACGFSTVTQIAGMTLMQYFMPRSYYIISFFSTMWSVAGIREVIRIVIACGFSTVTQIAGMTLMQYFMPRSYYIISFFGLCITVTGIRLSYRIKNSLFPSGNRGGDRIMIVGAGTSGSVILKEMMTSRHTNGTVRLSYRIKNSLFPSGNRGGDRIMIVGAGTSGSVILKEMMTSRHTNGTVVCFVDDDPNKKGKYLNGVPIAGSREDIPSLAKEYRVDEIYVAIPSAPAKERKKIIEICRETDCRIKVLPGIYQLLNGEVSVAKLREVQIEDLLGRDPIRVNLDEIMGYVQDKVILVTGGGGSIGSELCRQIAGHRPKQLIVFDVYENNAYDLQQELERTFPELNLTVLIGSVRNTHRIETVFETYRPDIVYHAAAHKHVPLMENSPNEAIKNNVFGTYKTARAAGRYGAKRFVLISTDKAVNPTNIMGASKRMCEMVVQMMDRRYKTEFVAVRFGNVLGSNGSV